MKKLNLGQTLTSEHKALEALWVLSGFEESVNPRDLAGVIAKAPDPETACQVILERLPHSTEALFRQWRKVIQQTWLQYHPNACASLELPLTSEDVYDVKVLKEVHAFLNEVALKPLKMVKEHGEWVIAPEELKRISGVLSSDNDTQEEYIAEHEWNNMALRRLRALLQACRLVRVFQGKLVVVHSRHHRLRELPLPQQFYALWHADVYHVRWGDFAGKCEQHVSILQHYIPLMWEMTEDMEQGVIYSLNEVSRGIVDTFAALWDEEQIFPSEARPTLKHIYEQCLLPSMIERLVVQDLFVRYGLCEEIESIENLFRPSFSLSEADSHVRLTRIGKLLFRAEREQDLPCHSDILF